MSAHPIVSSSKKRVSSSSRLVIFTYEKDLKTVRQAYSDVPARYWDELKLKKTTRVASFEAHQGFESSIRVFLISSDVTPFELQEAIRKGVEFSSAETNGIEFDVSRIKTDLAETLIISLGVLSVLEGYQAPVFGKRAEKKDEKKKDKKPLSVVFIGKITPARAQTLFNAGRDEGEAANLVRHLAELPGNELRPKNYIEIVKEKLKGLPVQIEFLDQKKLKALGANAFLAVVASNPSEPYGILRLSYRPKGAQKKVALVGKGLCYDTGGYNIKVGSGMYEMHRDMTGSAVAFALFQLLVKRRVNYTVDTYLALAENLISPTAYRPNDVITASNGVSIEVVDTDAEGRMALADTLVMASKEKPNLIIDFATLTGAVIRAIDTQRSGVFSNSEKLVQIAREAGDDTGERVWNFPIGGDYLKRLESEYADIMQCASGNNADHIYAATFLSQFIENDCPWLHVDLASESNKGGLGLSARDITGYGVRLGAEVLKRFL